MNYELVFSVSGMLSMAGWLALLASPWMPAWSDRIAGWAIPLVLSLGYFSLLVFFPPESGGFDSLAEVSELFSNDSALMAGWIHYLAFDLFIGAWICRRARQDDLPFGFVLPCLPLTFLFGPVGLLLFSAILGVRRLRQSPASA